MASTPPPADKFSDREKGMAFGLAVLAILCIILFIRGCSGSKKPEVFTSIENKDEKKTDDSEVKALKEQLEGYKLKEQVDKRVKEELERRKDEYRQEVDKKAAKEAESKAKEAVAAERANLEIELEKFKEEQEKVRADRQKQLEDENRELRKRLSEPIPVPPPSPLMAPNRPGGSGNLSSSTLQNLQALQDRENFLMWQLNRWRYNTVTDQKAKRQAVERIENEIRAIEAQKLLILTP